MKSVQRIVKTTMYVSEMSPDLETSNKQLGQVLAWADDNPSAYEVVTTGKSRAFGRGAARHIGWAQKSDSVEAIIERLNTLHSALAITERPGQAFCRWQANFALERVNEVGFTGGLFQQHSLWSDGKVYARDCKYVDYTPETLEDALDRFMVWMSNTFRKETVRITVEGVTKRTLREVVEAELPTLAPQPPSMRVRGKRAKTVRLRS